MTAVTRGLKTGPVPWLCRIGRTGKILHISMPQDNGRGAVAVLGVTNLGAICCVSLEAKIGDTTLFQNLRYFLHGQWRTL